MKKRSFTSEFKVKVVLEILREERSLSEIASYYEINPNLLSRWRNEFLERVPSLFEESKQELTHRRAVREAEIEKTKMYATIGQLTMERDYLKAATEKLGTRGLL